MYLMEIKKKKACILLEELLLFLAEKEDDYQKTKQLLFSQNSTDFSLCEKHYKHLMYVIKNNDAIKNIIYGETNEKIIDAIENLLEKCYEQYSNKENWSNHLKEIVYKEQKYTLLVNSLEKAIDSYANIGQRLKTVIIGSSLEKALDLVLKNDIIISQTASKYSIEKEIIQSIIFQEQRFLGIDDPIADSLVRLSYAYDDNLNRFIKMESLVPPQPVPGYRTDSSTGIGQIFAKTAINAINHYAGENLYDPKSKKDIQNIWNKLQEKDFNIDTIGAVLAYKKSFLISKNSYSNYNLLKSYNGSNEWAEKYAAVTEKYANAFRIYNENS